MSIYMCTDQRNGTVTINGKSLNGTLRKLPTVAETLKTHNKSLFVKTGDVCQILDCLSNDNKEAPFPHGLAPPLKNARKKRFRKCLINKDESAINVHKELFYLLQADLEAVSLNKALFLRRVANISRSSYFVVVRFQLNLKFSILWAPVMRFNLSLNLRNPRLNCLEMFLLIQR